jgi:hypothetical protein
MPLSLVACQSPWSEFVDHVVAPCSCRFHGSTRASQYFRVLFFFQPLGPPFHIRANTSSVGFLPVSFS